MSTPSVRLPAPDARVELARGLIGRGRDYFGPAVAVAILLGVVVRAFHVLSVDFPLNDGGMFYAMTRDLQAAGYQLPAWTSYNGGDIPFAYPPLGFYAAGLLDDLTPLSLLDVFRFLPLLATCLTLPAFYLLARRLLDSRLALVAAVLAFALIPRAYVWMLMGGGITRSFGFLFAILALYFVHIAFKNRERSALAWAVLFCSLTLLSHLETAWFLAFSIAVFFLFWGRHRFGLAAGAVIALGTLIVTAPWWVTVLDQHGLSPFLAASGTGGTVFAGGDASRWALLGFLRFVATSEPLFPLIGVLGLFGVLVSVVAGRFFLPVWWASVALLDTRSFATYSTVAVALLAGIAAVEVLLPLVFNRLAAGERASSNGDGADGNGHLAAGRLSARFSLPLIVLVVLAGYATTASFLRAPWTGAENQILNGLSREERQAFAWAEERLPEGSRFLIIPETIWETARVSEWFPALTGHLSVATVQGSEWLEDDGFEQARDIYDDAFQCAFRTTACLTSLMDAHDITFDYVYIRQAGGRPCCYTLLRSLAADPLYRLAFRNSAAVIYENVTAAR